MNYEFRVKKINEKIRVYPCLSVANSLVGWRWEKQHNFSFFSVFSVSLCEIIFFLCVFFFSLRTLCLCGKFIIPQFRIQVFRDQ